MTAISYRCKGRHELTDTVPAERGSMTPYRGRYQKITGLGPPWQNTTLFGMYAFENAQVRNL